jgi:hypothetical protein
MAFFLALPPTEHISESAEVRFVRAKEAQEFRNTQKKMLGVSAKALVTLSSGAFRGTEVVPWDEKYNGIVYTAFVYPKDKNQSVEWLRLVALIRQTDCVLMGATWEWPGMALKDAPESLKGGGEKILQAKNRTFDLANTYRFEPLFSGPFASRGIRLLEIMGGEALAGARIPAVSSLGRGWCDAEFTPDFKRTQVATYPARAHRILTGQWQENTDGKKRSWPQARGSFWLSSGTFGERKETVFEQKEFQNFSPATISNELVKKLSGLTHKLTDTEFTIIKRDGRWVYLDRGRAFGLEIGTHLVARGAKLHVIQYAPEEKEFDVAIALVRNENVAEPLKVGDKVSFDLTKYPKKE